MKTYNNLAELKEIEKQIKETYNTAKLRELECERRMLMEKKRITK